MDFNNTSPSANAVQWDFGDGTTSTQNNPSHTYGVSGTYLVQLQLDNGCLVQYSVSVDNIGTDEVQWDASIYPNPTTGILHIDFTQHLQEEIQLEVVSMEGKLLYSEVISPGEIQHTVDMSGLAAGLYLVSMGNGHDQLVERILLQKE